MEGGRAGIVELRRALRDNPYHKLHRRYNRNLIDDDNQELSEHLEWRHQRSRRMTHLATLSRLSAASDPARSPLASAAADDCFSWPKRQIHSELDGFLPENAEGLEALLSRAGQRGAFRKTSFASSAGDDSPRPPAGPPLSPQPSQLHFIQETEDDSLLAPQPQRQRHSANGSSFCKESAL